MSKPRPWKRVFDHVRRDYPNSRNVPVKVTCCLEWRTFATAAICVPVKKEDLPIYHCGACLFSEPAARNATNKAAR